MIRDAIRQIAESAYGFAVFDRLGVLRVGTLDLSGKTSAATILEPDISFASTPFPADGLRVGYKRSWTTHSNDDLAGNANAARRDLATNAYRYTRVNTDAATYNPLARPRTYETLLSNATDAVAIGVAAGGLHKFGWRRATVRCRNQQLARTVGELVTLKHSRFGLSAGVDALVLSVSEDLSRGELATLVVIIKGG